jgi:hypothetical protein
MAGARALPRFVLATAVTIVGVAGTAVTTHVAATAAPCSSWRANSQNLVLNLSNGQTAIFELNLDRNQFSDNARDAILQVPGKDNNYNGNAQGLVAGGNGRIDFTVIWTPVSGDFGGPSVLERQITSRFTGNIGSDGTATGSAVDNTNYSVTWTAPGAYSCADAPPNPDNPPRPDDPPAPTVVNCEDPAVAEANSLICKTAPYVLFGPKDVVTMDISVFFGVATVDITNTNGDIAGTCTYDATSPNLPSVNRTFDLEKNGSTSFTLLAPPVFTTYQVVLSCKGPWNGKTVEFGHVERDVTAAG